jgi:carboxyl-terminal processing protease
MAAPRGQAALAGPASPYNRGMSPRTRLVVAFVSTALTAYIALGVLLGRVLGDTTYSQLSVFNEVVRLVLEAYVEPVNIDKAMAGANLGLTEALDGDSAYLTPEDFAAYLKGPDAAAADIGVVLTRRFGFLMVVSTRPGSPAEKAGLETGDIIKTIDGRHSRTIPVPVGDRLLQGAPGSEVRLELLRARHDPREVAVVRERLTPAEPERRQLDDGTGYLHVREFSPDTAENIRGQLEMLRRDGASRLVLDLRGAAYGAEQDAVGVAEAFLKGGVVAQLGGRREAERTLTAAAQRNAWDLPLAVLVDNGTAGPGEIVAAALLEAERGPLVGQRTFGRAPLQRAIPLPEGGLVLTVAKYMTPKGKPIHGEGVEPSVVVEPRSEDAAEEGAAAPPDAVLEKALELLNATALKKAA